MVHFSKSDFQLEWFLEFVFDKSPPPGSVVTDCIDLFCKESEDEIVDVLKKWKIPYSIVISIFLEISNF